VASGGSLGGFGGERMGPKLKKKKRLLEQEGVVFLPDGRVAPESIVDSVLR